MAVTYVRYWCSYLKHPYTSHLLGATMQSVRRAGWKAVLVCSRPPDDPRLANEIVETGTEIVYLPRPRGNFDPACVWHAYRLLKRFDCTIMHCDNMHTSPLIGATLAGVPVRLWSKRSMNTVYETMREATLRDRIAISLRITCWLATQVLAVSSVVKQELVDLGIADAKLRVLPNPAEVEPFNGQTRHVARTELGYGDEDMVFTTVGHAVPVKGWDVLLGAFAKVLDQYPGARLQFVGSVADEHEQEHYARLARYIRQQGIDGQVHFLGHQRDVRKSLAAADVFVLPSRSEGYGNVLIEAMTYGLPCIATKVGCATDVIRDGANGLLVERGSEKELGRAMLSLARDRGLRRRITCAVRAQEKYAPTFSEYGDQLVEICGGLLRSRTAIG